jgi:hypothetical protein
MTAGRAVRTSPDEATSDLVDGLMEPLWS